MISIVALVFFRLTPGLDFSAGSLLTVHFEQPVEQSALRQTLDTLGYQNATVQSSANGDYIIHTQELDEAAKDQLMSDLSASSPMIQPLGHSHLIRL